MNANRYVLPEGDQRQISQKEYSNGALSMSSHSSTNHTNHHHAQRQRNETHSTRNDIRMVGKSLKYKKETCRYHLLTGYLKTTEMNAKIIKSHFSATRFITYLTTDKSISSQTTHTKNAARRTTKLSPFSLKQKKRKEEKAQEELT